MFPFFRLYGFDIFLILWGLFTHAYEREGTLVCPCSVMGNIEITLAKSGDN